MNLFYQHKTSHDDPNAVLSVGDRFGFIIHHTLPFRQSGDECLVFQTFTP